MRARNTALLAAACMALATYIYFFELRQSRQEGGGRLLTIKIDEVANITLTYPDREIRFQRKPSGQWSIIQPVQARADAAAISGILAALAESEVQRIIEAKPGAGELQAFGLDRPEIKVAISLKDGTAMRPLWVGAVAPVGNSVYVQREGRPQVLLTGASLRATLDKKLDDFRDRTILGSEAGEVQGSFLEGTK